MLILQLLKACQPLSEVLIAAKCNVNYILKATETNQAFVLIAAKCNVNKIKKIFEEWLWEF